MKAVFLDGPHRIAIRDVPKPQIQRDTDVIIRVTASSICMSDVHYHEGYLPIESPIHLGHEFVGVVVELGAAVRTLGVGDRVAVAPYAWCGACESCRRGQESWCVNGALFGSGKGWGDLAGGLSEFARVINADTACVRIPDGVTDEHAVLVGDVAATGFFGVEQCGLQPGQTIAIFGAGPIGLSAVQTAAMHSPSRIFLVDLIESRLELGAQLGATDVILASETDPVAAIRAATDRGHPFLSGVDASVDCVGLEVTVDQASKSLAKGGVLSIVGVPHPGSFGIDLQMAQLGNQTLKVGVTPQRHMRTLLGFLERGTMTVEPFVTHIMPLTSFHEAFEMFAHHEDGCMKVILKP